jgi:acyl-CoA synthetase (AMP-forming)/AMP-acid ligase II
VTSPPELPFVPTLPQLIRVQADRFGERDLLVDERGRCSYRDADRGSAALARRLVAAGVGKGTRVGILFPNGVDWLLAFFAVARIGAIAIQISTFAQPPELHELLRQADVSLLLTAPSAAGHDLLARLEQAVPQLSGAGDGPLYLPAVPSLRAVWVWGDRPPPGWARRPDAIPVPKAIDDELLRGLEDDVAPGDPLLMVATSGTTAEPKVVVHSHGGLVRHGANLARVLGLDRDERLYTTMPLFWIGGISFNLLAVMHMGGCLLVEERFDASRALDFIERERATFVSGWQYATNALAADPSLPERELSNLRPNQPVWWALHPSEAPTDPALRHNSLGMTETGGPHTYGSLAERGRDLPEKWRGSFGPPLPGIEHRIVDPESGAVLPDGIEGEICIRGYSLMLGLNKRERHETFDPDGWYHSGDRGYFRDGLLFFTGRVTEMIKTKGANVAPREVEVVLESFPEVLHAIVVGVAHPELGQEVVATVALQPEVLVTADELAARAKEQLASYKVPRRIVFVDPASLPMTPSGKVDRRVLQRALESE